MRYYIVAGEASGDLHGSNLIKEIKKLDDNASFRLWGGDKMKSASGTELVEHYKNTSYMGFAEVASNLRKIFSFLKRCKSDIESWNPDVVVLIDYPGFNLRIAEFAKKKGFKVVYYISPQVWAWKARRVKKIKRTVDKMLVIFPFEVDYYKSNWNYDVEFVGHPLFDEIDLDKIEDERKEEIVLLPGSRKQEIKKHLPIMLSVVEDFPEYNFRIAGLNQFSESFYKSLMNGVEVEICYNKTYDLLSDARAALVSSGTATLETALFNVPQVICYKGSWVSYQIGKRLVDIEFIGIVNLIMGKEIVPELIQNDFNKKTLENELTNVLESSQRDQILDEYSQLRRKLGEGGASKKAAEAVIAVSNKI